MSRYDAIVVGAGAAGLTAAIYLSRARVKTLVLDSGMAGGQMNLTHEVANYPGVSTLSGAELARAMKDQAQSFGTTLMAHADILSMDLSGTVKRFEVDDEGTFEAPAVILAPGGSPRTLGLASEESFRGRGVSYCATCDGDFFADQEIVVVGGGNSALEEAVSLTKYASKVTIIHEFDEFQAHAYAIEEARANSKVHFLMNQRVLEIAGADGVTGVLSREKRTGSETHTPGTGVFIFIGYVPNTRWLEGHVALNERGEIVTDDVMATDKPGVFAAGDARVKRYRQITTAVADGTIAALAAADFINEMRRHKL